MRERVSEQELPRGRGMVVVSPQPPPAQTDHRENALQVHQVGQLRHHITLTIDQRKRGRASGNDVWSYPLVCRRAGGREKTGQWVLHYVQSSQCFTLLP